MSAPPSQYFTSLAANYARQTGDSTRLALRAAWPSIQTVKPITSASAVHDNAAGPGTATSVLLDNLPAGTSAPEILITDNNPAMVAAAKKDFASCDSVTCREMDADELDLPPRKFTHSITNVSIFLFKDAVAAMKGVHGSLQPDGLNVVLTWKRFGFGHVLHAAQARVRPDLPVLPLPGAQFLQEGVLAQTLVDAGFAKEKITVTQQTVLVTGDNLESLKSFMLDTSFMLATKEWTEDDKKKFPEAVDAAFKSETDEHGGVLFVMWAALATK